MALSVMSKCVDQVAEITLVGDLDESSVSLFEAELEKVAKHTPKRLVLYLCGLKFMASVGVRMLLVVKNRLMKWEMDIYAIAPQEQFLEVLERVKMRKSVIVQPEYKP
jgi:anti-anti-sigma factor